MEIPLLKDILIIFALSTIVLFVCHRLKIPTIVSFLLTGFISGPHGFALINATEQVEILSEIGIVFLLFTIGIEFSLKSLWQIRRGVLLGGYLQVLFSILATVIVAKAIGFNIGESIFFGFLVSLSSSAIVLKTLNEKAEITSPHGRVSLGILIFQDVIIVPMILFTPLLAGATEDIGREFLIESVVGISIIVLVIASARWIVPKILYQIAKTRDRELFLFCTVLICLAVAWLTSMFGLSLALGAFLAGLIISESEFNHHALNNVLPFKDVFSGLFFVSVGMLLDINLFFQHPYVIILTAVGIMLLKLATASASSAILGFPPRTNFLVGLALCQVGEFSFILSRTGLQNGLLNGDIYNIFLSVSILTMAITPFLISSSTSIIKLIAMLPVSNKFKNDLYQIKNEPEKTLQKNHAVIIGFGMNGRILAKAAKETEIPYVILESNPETVKVEGKKGEPIFFGDATQEAVLNKANIKDCKIVVVAVSDLYATNIITKLARSINPLAYIVVRTRYVEQSRIFYQLGANYIVTEEVETAAKILSVVLNKYFVKEGIVESYVNEIHSLDFKPE